MRVLLTSAGLETEKIKDYFVDLLDKDAASVKALFIPVAATNADAIAVLPKCMNDLLKCGIPRQNIIVCDLHENMGIEGLRQYDLVYICGGETCCLLRRINETGFGQVLREYIRENGIVLGVSAGSLIFANNIPGNLGLIDTKLDVHCAQGETPGKLPWPLKENVRLTNFCALSIKGFPDELEIIGE